MAKKAAESDTPEARDASLNIYQRIAAVMREIPYVKKDDLIGKEGSSWSYMAVTHDLITAMVRPLFLKYGIGIEVRQTAGTTTLTGTLTGKGTPIIRFEGAYEVDFVNIDVPTDRICNSIVAHANDEGDKAPGKCVSYAIKTVLLKGLQIETGESDESRIPENGAGAPEEKKTIESPTSKSGKSQASKDSATPASGKGDPPQERADVEKCSAGTAKMIKSYVDLKGPEALKHVKQALVNLNIDKFSDMPKAEAKMLLDHLKSMPDNDAVGNV